MTSLSGRRILFVGIGFYDYENGIVERLRQMGASVVAFDDSPVFVREGLWAGLLRRMPGCTRFILHRHEQAMLGLIAGRAFDQVLVIKSSGLSVEFLKKLRASQPAAEFILYQWDALARVPGIQERLPLFDRVLTFDRQDVIANPRLQFRPLFYRESGGTRSEAQGSPAIDVSFVGLLHSDRLRAARDVEASARESGLTTFVYLYTGLLTWLKLFLRGEARGVHVRPIAYSVLMDVNRRSRCILDLSHGALQSGLTMRAIEAVGLGKKIITTGQDIQFYDFYRPENIDIVNAGRVRINPDFVSRSGAPVPDEVLRRYSLDAWIEEVFGVHGMSVSGESPKPSSAARVAAPNRRGMPGFVNTRYAGVATLTLV